MRATYWRLWWAAAVDALGDGVFTAAVPLLAVTLTSDPRLIAVLSAVTYLPWLLLSLPAGALVDRHDRATLMWRTQVVQALLIGAAAVLAALHALSLPVMAIIAFGLGACEVLFGNAAQAILPDLVAKPLLHQANGYQQAVIITGQQFAGPPLGSLLFAVSAALPLTLDAVTFAVSAALVATLPRNPPGTRPKTPITDGLRWLARHRLLRTLAALLAVNTFCAQLGNATLVLFATETLHLSTRGYGLLLTGAAVGSLVAGLLDIHARRALHVALVGNVVIFVAIGLSPNALVLALLLAANGFATTLWTVVTVSLRQQLVPAELLGRVNSVYRMLGWGLMPFGALAGGLVAHLFGLRAPYPIAGLLRGIAFLALRSGL
ncbi:MFS transporter [Amycolatopsis deserti]|uniref:MFS transporter n=1 Tax=Amycolatopsis deserti TaxID=185696 RepID=A0ABQ3J789_9PSEU|nr:MFS transporter [Amycolatopsis deserti]GHF06272.1 MFS transporter [Amycolatopsis deserti]